MATKRSMLRDLLLRRTQHVAELKLDFHRKRAPREIPRVLRIRKATENLHERVQGAWAEMEATAQKAEDLILDSCRLGASQKGEGKAPSFRRKTDAQAYSEFCRRYPTFSVFEFEAETEKMIMPTLDAFLKGDLETLRKNCSHEFIEKYVVDRRARESQGIFWDNKVLQITDFAVGRAGFSGMTPTIIVHFRAQQTYCVRDEEGRITDGGEDTICRVDHAWAMQLSEEGEEGALHPVWKLVEVRNFEPIQWLVF